MCFSTHQAPPYPVERQQKTPFLGIKEKKTQVKGNEKKHARRMAYAIAAHRRAYGRQAIAAGK